MTILWPNGLTTPPNFSWEGHFGWRNAGGNASRYHRGQDFYGIGEIKSIADGTVVHVGYRAGWAGGGYMVWIQHDGYFSRNLHLVNGSSRVSVGQKVRAGQAIGTEGNTPGGMADHLHLEITPGQWHSANDGQVDPRAWLEKNVGTHSGAGGGGQITDNIGGKMEAYLLHTNGSVYYVRPGLKKKFTSVDDYNAWRETVNGLRSKKQTNMMKVPYITSLKVLSDWRFNAIVNGIV